MSFKTTPKGYTGEQDKARPPEETVAWARGRFEALGSQILRKVMRIDSGRLDIPVFISLCGDRAKGSLAARSRWARGPARPRPRPAP